MSPWLLFIVIGLITFSIRYLPIALAGRDLPPLMLRALRYVPPAVLSAIFVPEIVMPTGTLNLTLANPRIIAGVLAIGVAYFSKNVLLTILVGMVALWVVGAMFR